MWALRHSFSALPDSVLTLNVRVPRETNADVSLGRDVFFRYSESCHCHYSIIAEEIARLLFEARIKKVKATYQGDGVLVTSLCSG